MFSAVASVPTDELIKAADGNISRHLKKGSFPSKKWKEKDQAIARPQLFIKLENFGLPLLFYYCSFLDVLHNVLKPLALQFGL